MFIIDQWRNQRKDQEGRNIIFLVNFSGIVGQNIFLTRTASQEIFWSYFQKSRQEYYFLCLFYFLSPSSGHLRSDFVVLLLLLTVGVGGPEKRDKKSKRDMKRNISYVLNFSFFAFPNFSYVVFFHYFSIQLEKLKT